MGRGQRAERAMTVNILHVHSTFALGGKEARAVGLMNAFGAAARHTIFTAMPAETSARAALAPGVEAHFPEPPPLTGWPTPLRLRRIARAMRGFDLVLTYNWGAFDAVMARRLYGGPPLVHHEDGFNADEAQALMPRRSWYRRLGLPAAARLVVPSEGLEAIARTVWHQPQGKVARIPNGIPVRDYGGAPDRIPGIEKQPGETLVGAVAGLRPVKNLPRLVRAFAAMTSPARLVIVGTGPDSERIAAEARRLGVGDRVHMPGFLPDPARWIGSLDVFALSSDSEQQPISLLEAMAAGLPAVATAVGDVPRMVAPDNAPLIVAAEDEAAFAAALDTLAARPDLRRAIGRANREKAAAAFDEAAMVDHYARVYGEAIGRPDAFVSGSA
jgi:glycosyltransferase involved in cell wall biosynthesis